MAGPGFGVAKFEQPQSLDMGRRSVDQDRLHTMPVDDPLLPQKAFTQHFTQRVPVRVVDFQRETVRSTFDGAPDSRGREPVSKSGARYRTIDTAFEP